MTRLKTRTRALRTLAAPFTVAAPTGARIRTRLRLSPQDADVLWQVGRHLGSHYRADLAARVRIGTVSAKETRRTERKKALTAVSSSRWAGAMTRRSEDQYQLAMRTLRAEVVSLARTVKVIRNRLAVPCGQRAGRISGYPTRSERTAKQGRLHVLTARLDAARNRLESGHPTIVLGGRRLLGTRHDLDHTGLTEHEWRRRWDAARVFLTADGESGVPYGNYTIAVDPTDGSVSLVLPLPLRHLANSPRGRYRLACTVAFSHRREEWLDRVTANRAVRYDITFDARRGRQYLDASWSTPAVPQPAPEDLAGERLLGVDLNANHLAACVIDGHGNPIGNPHTIPLDLSGSTTTRDGRLRAAITELIRHARQHGCAGIAIENLAFTDARTTGRETMGRGRRGKAFRRTVAGIPTGRFRDRIAGMSHHAGLVVIAVDPAYTSRWGGRHWHAALSRQTTHSRATRHHAASLVIARRAHGHGARRRPGVTRARTEDRAGRATGQTGSRAMGARIAKGPPRTPRTTPMGKTRQRHGGTPATQASRTVREAAGQHTSGIGESGRRRPINQERSRPIDAPDADS
ncbi:hypothetical protein [Streptomyces syringium]|uniref:hypothetical protein n=1 Tax=Streptomyces syringium TaxID=76729 RepID=UPI00344A4F06